MLIVTRKLNYIKPLLTSCCFLWIIFFRFSDKNALRGGLVKDETWKKPPGLAGAFLPRKNPNKSPVRFLVRGDWWVIGFVKQQTTKHFLSVSLNPEAKLSALNEKSSGDKSSIYLVYCTIFRLLNFESSRRSPSLKHIFYFFLLKVSFLFTNLNSLTQWNSGPNHWIRIDWLYGSGSSMEKITLEKEQYTKEISRLQELELVIKETYRNIPVLKFFTKQLLFNKNFFLLLVIQHLDPDPDT